MRHIFWSCALALALTSGSQGVAVAEERLALVIGLSNPADPSTSVFVQDAKHVAASLAKAGFTVRTSINPTPPQLTRAVQQYVRLLTPGSLTTVVYVAAPLVIAKGKAYLNPSSTPVGTVNQSSLDVGALLDQLSKAGVPRTYVAFDFRPQPPGERVADLPLSQKATRNLFVGFGERGDTEKGRSGLATIISESARMLDRDPTGTQNVLESAIVSRGSVATGSISIDKPYDKSHWFQNGFIPLDLARLWSQCPELPPRFSARRLSAGNPTKVASVVPLGASWNDERWAWGDDGLRTSDFGPTVVSSIPVGVLIEFNINPIIVGTGVTAEGRSVVAMSGHYGNGYPLSFFGDGGFMTVDIPGYENAYASGTLDMQGNTLVGGYAVADDGRRAVFVAKLWAYHLPTWYGTNGRVSVEIPNAPKLVINGIAPADKYYGNEQVLVGTADYKSFLLVKLKSDGSLDGSFGTNGVARLPLTCGAAYGVARDDLGRFVVVGYTTRTSGPKLFQYPVIAVARFMPDGKLDTLFGTNGLTVIDIPYSNQEYGTDVVVWSAPALSQGSSQSPPAQPGQPGTASVGPTLSDSGLPVVPVTSITPVTPTPIEPPAPEPWMEGQVVEIFVGANARNASGDRRFTLLRIKNNGLLETNFGTNGFLQIDFAPSIPGDSILNALKVDYESGTPGNLETAYQACTNSVTGVTGYCGIWRLMAIGSANYYRNLGLTRFALAQIKMNGEVAWKTTMEFPNGGYDSATAFSKTFRPDFTGAIQWNLLVGVQ